MLIIFAIEQVKIKCPSKSYSLHEYAEMKTRTRHMAKTYSQMRRTNKHSKHSSIIWPVWLNS